VQLVKFPDDLLTELGKISGEVVDQVGNTDAMTKKVWDSYRSFRKIALGWTKTGTQGYLNARSLPFTYGQG